MYIKKIKGKNISGDIMCTAVTFTADNFYFGRTLDYEKSFGESVALTPRNYAFNFTNGKNVSRHYAILGMAHIENGYPLYYDAFNEKGLSVAGLNFVGNACYNETKRDMENVPVFELIPYILSLCKNVAEAKEILYKTNITATPFNEKLGTASLHWIIADKNECITVEAVKEGLKVYENRVGVLTNNPPFKEQMHRLNDYMYLSAKSPQNNFSDKLDFSCYSRGMGAMGLPGDFSSSSRFVRAVFIKMNSPTLDSEEENVGQFFHIMDSVAQPLGSVMVEKDEYEKTIYTSCINADKGIYYYTSYSNRQINAVNMYREDLNGQCLKAFEILNKQKINGQN